MAIDFRRRKGVHPPLTVNGESVEQVASFNFVGTQIWDDLTWTGNMSMLVKKGQQRLHFLHSNRQKKKIEIYIIIRAGTLVR